MPSDIPALHLVISHDASGLPGLLGQPDMLEGLEERYEGLTPLLRAVSHNRPQMFDQLLKAGADPTAYNRNTGDNVVHLLAQHMPSRCTPEVLGALHARSVDLERANTAGDTPLLHALRRATPERLPGILALLAAGCDPHRCDSLGQPGLVLLLQAGKSGAALDQPLEMEAVFAAAGWNLDAPLVFAMPAMEGFISFDLPLHWAAERAPGWVPLLLEHGASVNARDPSGRTALMRLARHWQDNSDYTASRAALHALYAHGIEAHARNDRGQTAWDLLRAREGEERNQSLFAVLNLPEPADQFARWDAWVATWKSVDEAAQLQQAMPSEARVKSRARF